MALCMHCAERNGLQQLPSAMQAKAILDRRHRYGLHGWQDTQGAQHPRRVGAELDAGPNLGKRRRLLKNPDVMAASQQQRCAAQATDSGTDNHDLLWPNHT
jgi:hypothetical protein